MREKHLEELRVRQYSEYTIKDRSVQIGFFLAWCADRGLTEPVEVTRTVLEAYQRYVFHYRKKDGEPLSFSGQEARIVPLRVWFKWMARHHYILHKVESFFGGLPGVDGTADLVSHGHAPSGRRRKAHSSACR